MDSYGSQPQPKLPQSLPKDPVLRLRALAARATAQRRGNYSAESDALSALEITEAVATVLADYINSQRSDGK